ncbi:MAG TPA: flagellar hook-associated protein FlgK [Steroidobacteraceae bacterium]|jgi:flagellar hook-associated protein 1 FlgK|nr:flagellar hook-associated protein FlgK [Steroidobacteraceae bacterium]
MADVLSTSVSGLLAFQQALAVTSNNVSNVSTPGYSEESIELTPQVGQSTTIGNFGTGVQVAGVTRNYSELLAGQMRTSQSSYSSFNTFATSAATVDNMLSDTTTGLSAQLQTFSNSLQTLANSPTLPASGTAVLSAATSLAQSVQGYASQLQTTEQDVQGQISSNIQEINSLAGSIADVNSQISAQSNTGQQPNSLLDQRDELIDQLSQYVSVSTDTQSNGSMNVFIGNGQSLVSGGTAQTLSAIPNQYSPTQYDVALQTAGTSTPVDITSAITGGSLGGLLSVSSQVINPALNSLGQISIGIANVVNQQQAAGLTQAGTQGQPLFAVGAVQVSPSSNNTGSAQLTATVTNVAGLTTDDYKLTDNNGTWQLYDQTAQQPVTLSGSGTALDPFTAAGISIVVNGTANSGDSYLVQPTANAAAGFSVLLTSPSQIASAAAVQTAAATTNTGSGTIAAATVTDPTNADLLTATSIVFSSPNQYQIDGTGPTYAYTPGAAITANGWTTSISGTPATGDTFTVSSNAGNVGDNTNLFAMIDGLKANSLNGGTLSLTGAATSLVSQVGAQTQQAQANAQAQQAVNTSATTAVNNLSGVNLDEEAANMVKYQQAYQACAQMIQASTTMFNTLITAISTA